MIAWGGENKVLCMLIIFFNIFIIFFYTILNVKTNFYEVLR